MAAQSLGARAPFWGEGSAWCGPGEQEQGSSGLPALSIPCRIQQKPSTSLLQHVGLTRVISRLGKSQFPPLMQGESSEYLGPICLQAPLTLEMCPAQGPAA